MAKKRSASGSKRRKGKSPKSQRVTHTAEANSVNEPERLKPRTRLAMRDEEGPLGWLRPTIESSYMHLRPRGTPLPPAAVAVPKSAIQFTSATLAPPQPTIWRDSLLEYKKRKSVSSGQPQAQPRATLAMPTIPGAKLDASWADCRSGWTNSGQPACRRPSCATSDFARRNRHLRGVSQWRRVSLDRWRNNMAIDDGRF